MGRIPLNASRGECSPTAHSGFGLGQARFQEGDVFVFLGGEFAVNLTLQTFLQLLRRSPLQ